MKLSDAAIQMYEAEADLLEENGVRPKILDDYEQYDDKLSEVVASCVALANELLAHKESDSQFTFVDIALEETPENVLAKLQNMPVGKVLSDDAAQLAIPSNGEYYPILDMRKQNATLVSVGLRIWGWDDTKVVFTNEESEQYTYPQHLLLYPSDEKVSTRKLELSFGYNDEESGGFSELVSLYLSSDGSATINSQVWASAYAETGYEGHGGSSLHDLTDDDVAAFGDLIAEIVGDKPESIAAKINHQLRDLIETAATPLAGQAIQDLLEATWPAQAQYYLTRTPEGASRTIAEQLLEKATVDAAIETINMIIKEWEGARSQQATSGSL